MKVCEQMVVNFANGYNFKGMDEFRNQFPHTIPDPVVPAPSVDTTDKVEITPDNESVQQTTTQPEAPKKKKRSFFQRMRDLYASFKKGVINATEYSKGTCKGIVSGAIGVTAVLGVDSMINLIKKAPNHLSTKGKVIAGVVGAVCMGVNLFKAYLNANEKKAQIDHRWQTGHDAE